MKQKACLFIFVIVGLFFSSTHVFAAGTFVVGLLPLDVERASSSVIHKDDEYALALAFSEMLASDLSKLQVLTLVERQNLNKIFEEQALMLGGLVDESTAVEIGKLLQASHLLSGKLIFAGSILTASLRVIDSETGIVLASSGIADDVNKIFSMQKELLEDLVHAWDLPLSSKERTALSQRADVKLAGVIQFGNAVEASDRGAFDEAATYLRSAVSLNPDFLLAEDLRVELEERFQQYVRQREEGLPAEIMDKLYLYANGNIHAGQDLMKMYWAFIQPLMLGNSYYGSWATLDEASRDWFFAHSVQPNWRQIGLPEEPASMQDMELYLGKKIYIAYRILESLLEKNVPVSSSFGGLHPVEGMTGYFLTLFSYVSASDWEFPSMYDASGNLTIHHNQYNSILLRYCDMFLDNFPYSTFSGMVTSMMHGLLN